jgi:hypothetical protein
LVRNRGEDGTRRTRENIKSHVPAEETKDSFRTEKKKESVEQERIIHM